MGMLVEGKWQDKWYDTKSSGGRFKRPETQFRRFIEPQKEADFPAEPDRYHLYVSYACPWAHRALILRKLKNLEGIISVSVVNSYMDHEGWKFDDHEDGSTVDHLFGYSRLHQVYTRAKADYTGRVTVPVLWDRKKDTIVNNESAEIIRMFNSAFDELDDAGDRSVDLYPVEHAREIDETNAFVYSNINNGVYKTGFATSQDAYEEAFDNLFSALDEIDARLGSQRYLTGNRLTEADWRLFTTLVRFDAVYVGHFKCNRQRIADYPNLSGYLRELYQWPGVAETVRMDHIKRHYYFSHKMINPTRIIPIGPDLDLTAPHQRDRLSAA